MNRLLTVCFWLAAALPIQITAGEQSLRYTVDLTAAKTQYIHVTLETEPAGDETQLMMPVWTPGSYMVREFAKHVDQISCVDENDLPLEVLKTRKNRWSIATVGATKIKVRYRVYCNELSVRSNWVGYGHAILNGAPTFLTVPEFMDRTHEVQLQLPDNWNRSATSLRAAGDEPHHYQAKSYNELVDSPIVAGNITIYPFDVAGVSHQLVNVNEREFWDGSRAANDLARIVAEHHKAWGNLPYDRYLFINVIGDGGGGLEHDNCCLIFANRWLFRDDHSYRRWLSLASHEFFHTWNIRRLRPKELVKYDYENEAYTPSLWVAEGLTSYYQDLLLTRAGLMEQEEFLEGLLDRINALQSREGRKIQSLRDSSHDAWIKFYRPADNSDETTVSYYSKGSVVAFLLDVEIRSRSEGRSSLDDAIRKLYQDHAGDVGYLPSDVRRICSELAGTDLSAWFDNAVDSTGELEYQNVCDWFGFQVGDNQPAESEDSESADGKSENRDSDPSNPPNESQSSNKSDEASDETDATGDDAEPDPKTGQWIGADIGYGTVYSIEPGSPAEIAGLIKDDEVIAIDGIRLSDSIESRLGFYRVGQQVQLLISRDDRIMELGIVIGREEVQPTWSLEIAPNPTEQQRANLEQWTPAEKIHNKN